MKNFCLFSLIPIALLNLAACGHLPVEPPDNPFEDIVFPEPPMQSPPPDSASIVGLHTYIFAQSCAVPGCHDGHFEPDFRTVQSSYQSLVFQPVIKNTLDESFELRVMPGNATESWLYYRVTTDDQDLGRMPLYDNPLTEGQIDALKTWINEGAKDLFDNPAIYPNTQPQIKSMAAFLDFNGFTYRVDTIRDGGATNPFGTLANRDLTIYIGMEDDSTSLENLQNARLLFSDHWDNFDNATVLALSYSPTPVVVPDYFGPGNAASFHWSVQFNTGQFPINEVTFFRLMVNDGAHAEDYVFPDDPHGLELKTFLSFFVAP